MKNFSKYVFIILIIISIAACSADSQTENTGIGLVTIEGNPISKLDSNESCINLIRKKTTLSNSYGQSDFTLYFTSDRSGTNRLYTADMFLDGVFSIPVVQSIMQDATNVPIRYFAVLPQNVSTNLQSDVVFYTTKDLQVRRNHVGLNEMNLYVGMGAGALSGLVIGVLPPNAVYPSFKIASNRFGLVVAQTNLPGIYELNVYEFDINMIDSAGIDALALKKRSFPQNAVQAGGGSWIPTTALDLPIDAFLYSADGLNGHDIYVTDF
ncbi:MAG: hypothetical protein KAR07_08280, partial [Spirochaetes bacterium]|nr:hypothetical protein [Spirochaetota bacterium]